jgi:hypothetical protein
LAAETHPELTVAFLHTLRLSFLAIRAVLLLAAAGLCVFGFLAAGEPGVSGYWRLGYLAGLFLSAGLLWNLWRTYRQLPKD